MYGAVRRVVWAGELITPRDPIHFFFHTDDIAAPVDPPKNARVAVNTKLPITMRTGRLRVDR